MHPTSKVIFNQVRMSTNEQVIELIDKESCDTCAADQCTIHSGWDE